MKRVPWKKPEREQLAIETLRGGGLFFVGLLFIGLNGAIAVAGIVTGLLSLVIVFGIALYDEVDE